MSRHPLNRHPLNRHPIHHPGTLPLIGVGHSCGALLHTIISSTLRGSGGMASARREANVLISFNNKRASDAIPFFAQIVTPAASSILELEQRIEQQPLLMPALTTARAVRRGLLELASARAAALAQAAADESAAAAAAAAAVAASGATRGATRGATAPSAAGAVSFWGMPNDPIAVSAALVPVVEQIKPILEEIEQGATEFEPPPPELRVAFSALYGAERTLVLKVRKPHMPPYVTPPCHPPVFLSLYISGFLFCKFSDDSIDESDELEAAIGRCGGVELRRLRGTHVTPLTPTPPGILPMEAEDVLGGASQREFEEMTSTCLEFISRVRE